MPRSAIASTTGRDRPRSAKDEDMKSAHSLVSYLLETPTSNTPNAHKRQNLSRVRGDTRHDQGYQDEPGNAISWPKNPCKWTVFFGSGQGFRRSARATLSLP